MGEIRYTYKIYDLLIGSEFRIDRLKPCCGHTLTDVEITVGDIPEKTTNTVIAKGFPQSGDNRFLLDIPNIARFFIQNGNRITIEPSEKGDVSSICLYLLGSAFGVLLYQRSVLPIHGSGIVIGGGCVIFTGDSGAGKSTLSSALRMMGYGLVTDDIAAVTVSETNGIMVCPSYPQQKLWKDSLEYLGIEFKHLNPITVWYEKYLLPSEEAFQDKPVPLAAICELIPSDSEDVVIHVLDSHEKLNLLIRNTYRHHFIKGLLIEETVFQQWGAIVKSVPMYKMYRPLSRFSIQRQASMILKEFGA